MERSVLGHTPGSQGRSAVGPDVWVSRMACILTDFPSLPPDPGRILCQPKQRRMQLATSEWRLRVRAPVLFRHRTM